jgi:hypothetical protein
MQEMHGIGEREKAEEEEATEELAGMNTDEHR